MDLNDVVNHALSIAIKGADEMQRGLYPDAISMVQDHLQEKQDNDELTELDQVTLNWINVIVEIGKM